MKSYTINYNDIFSFIFWFFTNSYKTKTVECDMRSNSSIRFNFKSDIYEGQGFKIKGAWKYVLRYFSPIIILFFIFPTPNGHIDYYIFSVLAGTAISFGILEKQMQTKAICGFFTAAVFLISFFYFGSIKSVGMLLLLVPQFFIFSFICLRIYYDVKDKMKKKLYFLQTPRIFFYA